VGTSVASPGYFKGDFQVLSHAGPDRITRFFTVTSNGQVTLHRQLTIERRTDFARSSYVRNILEHASPSLHTEALQEHLRRLTPPKK
jgi:hypothetical protein